MEWKDPVADPAGGGPISPNPQNSDNIKTLSPARNPTNLIPTMAAGYRRHSMMPPATSDLT